MVLDADGLSKLARRDRVAREMVRQEVIERDGRLVVPLVVAAQAFAGDAGDRVIREVVAAAHEAVGVDLDRAAEAASLMCGSGHRDAVDALVAAEALRRVPSIVVTSDPYDLRRLLDADAAGHRVAVWRI